MTPALNCSLFKVLKLKCCHKTQIYQGRLTEEDCSVQLTSQFLLVLISSFFNENIMFFFIEHGALMWRSNLLSLLPWLHIMFCLILVSHRYCSLHIERLSKIVYQHVFMCLLDFILLIKIIFCCWLKSTSFWPSADVRPM